MDWKAKTILNWAKPQSESIVGFVARRNMYLLWQIGGNRWTHKWLLMFIPMCKTIMLCHVHSHTKCIKCNLWLLWSLISAYILMSTGTGTVTHCCDKVDLPILSDCLEGTCCRKAIDVEDKAMVSQNCPTTSSKAILGNHVSTLW